MVFSFSFKFYCQQTVETLIRPRSATSDLGMHGLPMSTKRTLGLYGLNMNIKISSELKA